MMLSVVDIRKPDAFNQSNLYDCRHRGEGRTSWQIFHAPRGAIFVNVIEGRRQVLELASKLERADITFFPACHLDALRGKMASGLIFDHSFAWHMNAKAKQHFKEQQSWLGSSWHFPVMQTPFWPWRAQ